MGDAEGQAEIIRDMDGHLCRNNFKVIEKLQEIRIAQ